MNLKKLLFSSVLLLLSASGVSAGQKSTLPPSLPGHPAGQNLLPFQPLLECTANYMRGDFNENEFWDLEDAVVMINCVFANPAGGLCLPCVVDINCDNRPTPVDMVLLLRFYIEPPIFEIRCPD